MGSVGPSGDISDRSYVQRYPLRCMEIQVSNSNRVSDVEDLSLHNVGSHHILDSWRRYDVVAVQQIEAKITPLLVCDVVLLRGTNIPLG